ncbi:P-loop containing nucleoside triphosphate hydrolase protein, partial [Blakeslea trispora]
MSEDEFDMLDLTAIQPSVNREDSEDDGFDDNDLDQLVEVTETVEQQRGQITFVSFGEHDPDPPPALPASTPSFHPFDPENLRTWIYPTNYTIRGYQFNIVQKAIFNNTLVALPTGLGKTFIAAVVMFNYYRWFPHSKIIFMAPTRPLVEQQIEACYTVCGLPQEDTVDMMGNTTPAKRKELWKSKRVFFATPQTVQKDLETAICPADKISCIVVDEAHKATGNFAYTAVVRRISKMNKHFRVLALTATPGSSLDAVQEVVNNLHITQIQIRTEDSMDIREFSHGKNIQHIVVKLSYTEGSTGLLPRVIQDYRSKVFGPLLLELSKKPTTVSADVDRASSFGLRSARLSFQLNAKNVPNTLKFQVISLFLVAEHAARAYELLCQHGIVPFVESMDSVLDEFNRTQQTGKKLNKSQRAFLDNRILQAILRNAKVEMVKPDFIGHPKMDQLVSILIQHFANLPEGASSKVMIFSSYRTSVQDICQVLNRHSPMLRPSFFVGQASDKNGVKGLKQSEQQEVIQKFKLDVFNILVSTSIGEEGLDIGEVDLIICFDSQSSPIRMLQRMGRTGRKRKGKCILLMTESEEKKFQQAKDAYAKIQGLIARGGLIRYYPENPAILPRHYKPTLCRKKLEVGQFKRKVVKRKRKLNEGDSIEFSSGLLKPEVKQAFVRSFSTPDHSYSSTEDLFDRLWPVQRMIKSVNRFMPLQTRLSACKVGHGQRSNQLVRLVQKMEHRILNPDDINLTHLTRPKQQEKLYLPSKGKAKQTTLFQHLIKHNSSKSILNRSKRVDDDDFADFMASHDMAQLIDTEAIFSASEEVKRQEEQEIVRKVHSKR